MLDQRYLRSIMAFEGYSARASWDYAQYTNGFGTRAASPDEVIDRAEAEKRFRSEIDAASLFVDKVAPGVPEGIRAALTSLTFNAGTAWAKADLGKAVMRGDFEAAKASFLRYDKAGGEVLAGLTARRTAEVSWIEHAAAAHRNAPAEAVAVIPARAAIDTQNAGFLPPGSGAFTAAIPSRIALPTHSRSADAAFQLFALSVSEALNLISARHAGEDNPDGDSRGV
ncbi:MAG: glycoside hydrolase family protein [Hyphomicrobium sp.]